MSASIIQRVFTRILEDTKGEMSNTQIIVLTAKTLGITPLEVACAVGVKT